MQNLTIKRRRKLVFKPHEILQVVRSVELQKDADKGSDDAAENDAYRRQRELVHHLNAGQYYQADNDEQSRAQQAETLKYIVEDLRPRYDIKLKKDI